MELLECKNLSKFYDKQESNNNRQLDFQKQQVEFWANQMTLVEEGSEEWDKAKENWLSAVSEWNSAVEAAIQNLQDKYLNAINEIFQKLNNEVTGGLGLGYVEEEWSLINRNAEEYLDSVNAIYGVQQLQSKYLDAIEQNDSSIQQKKLNDLMEKEDWWFSKSAYKNSLSEYRTSPPSILPYTARVGLNSRRCCNTIALPISPACHISSTSAKCSNTRGSR